MTGFRGTEGASWDPGWVAVDNAHHCNNLRSHLICHRAAHILAAEGEDKAKMRAVLESLLRTKKLDVTLTPFGPAGEPLNPLQDKARVAPTAVATLDAALGGGLRRGHLSEITGAASTGRTTLAIQALAAATARREAVALVH